MDRDDGNVEVYEEPDQQREPMLLVPGSIALTIGVLVAVHMLRSMLSQRADFDVLLTFAFIPARYGGDALAGFQLPGGLAADAWTFLTYALLHGSIMHLAINCLWLLAFGTPVARRFGPARYFGLFALTAVAGAALHLALHFGETAPVVGASAAISGLMAAATRFVFDPGAPLGLFRFGTEEAVRLPAESLPQVLTNGRAMTFVAVWFGLNLLVGLTSVGSMLGGQNVAWEAHIGGFVCGLLVFPLFDPVPRSRALV